MNRVLVAKGLEDSIKSLEPMMGHSGAFGETVRNEEKIRRSALKLIRAIDVILLRIEIEARNNPDIKELLDFVRKDVKEAERD